MVERELRGLERLWETRGDAGVRPGLSALLAWGSTAALSADARVGLAVFGAPRSLEDVGQRDHTARHLAASHDLSPLTRRE